MALPYKKTRLKDAGKSEGTEKVHNLEAKQGWKGRIIWHIYHFFEQMSTCAVSQVMFITCKVYCEGHEKSIIIYVNAKEK